MTCVIQQSWLGRWGNTMFQAAHALAYAEKWGCELQTDPWIGYRIFQLDYNPIREPALPRRSDHTLINGETNVSLHGYFQNRRSAIYNQEQIRRWFRFRPHVEAALASLIPADDVILAHQRVGDFVGYSYPVLAKEAYDKCCDDYSLDRSKVKFVTEEEPATHPDFTGDLAMLPDFFRLAKAKTVIRGNSSYSFWSSAIAEANGAKVYSPIIDGLVGGKFHYDVAWRSDNSARLSDHDFVDPIVIQP